MFIIRILIYSSIMIPYSVYYLRRYNVTPVSIFLIMQMTFFYGICSAPRGRVAAAQKLENIYILATIFFILGVELSRRVLYRYVDERIPEFIDADPTDIQNSVIWTVIIVSILACTYLFRVGGVNVFIQSLRNFVSDSNENLSKTRAGFFGVSGIGYIYQFRVVLLPVMASFILFGYKEKVPKIISIPIYILMMLFLLGTGQRNAFVFYCMIITIYAYFLQSHYHIQTLNRGQLLGLLSFAIFVMVILTISNGRVSDNGNLITGSVNSIIERFFSVNQRTAINAFIYIDSQPTVWGYDWLMMLRDILPGKSGYLSVDRIVYYLAYGTYNGTGPPCLWGSAWYNFNIFGVTVFPFFMGFFYHRTYLKANCVRYKNRLYILIYSTLCVYLGIWCYGTPMTLFNNGVVTIIMLRWLLFTLVPSIEKGRIVI